MPSESGTPPGRMRWTRHPKPLTPAFQAPQAPAIHHFRILTPETTPQKVDAIATKGAGKDETQDAMDVEEDGMDPEGEEEKQDQVH